VKRVMENVVMSRPREASVGAKKFLVMRTLARLHACDSQELLRSIDSTELEIHDTLRDMISMDEVKASHANISRGKRKATYTLTLNGWGEYMNALGSVYELPE
jgi:hypothetical protein